MTLLDIIVDDVASGITIASVGIIIYVWQKNYEKRTNKRDMARILRNEISQILQIIPIRDGGRIVSDKIDVFPNNTIHSGLLLSGNIRFFNDNLQAKLNEWYSSVTGLKITDSDVADDAIKLIVELEDMERKNNSYRDKTDDFLFDIEEYIWDFFFYIEDKIRYFTFFVKNKIRYFTFFVKNKIRSHKGLSK